MYQYSIPFYGQKYSIVWKQTFYLSTHQLMDTRLFLLFGYYEHLCTSFIHGHMLSFLLGVYLGIVGSYGNPTFTF